MSQTASKKFPNTIYLRDYKEPLYWIDHVNLDFELQAEKTFVKSQLHFRKNENLPSEDQEQSTLILDGEDLILRGLALDGAPLREDRYQVTADHLHVFDLPESGVLEIETEVNPSANTRLEGLYRSSGIFCTQCEAEGFRRITYYLDRPDVMATYRVRMTATQEDCPVLLSNGNLLEEGSNPDGTHWAEWEDPHPKPCYLFALVAGKLEHLEADYTTASGRAVKLRIYVEPGNVERCSYAMDALKRSMRWDEERFGLNYDLDCFNIVAVGDFNMGAMENKGLNIFNSKYILADADTATDADFGFIEAIVAHEYFHNWSGNRVTCRDWFQLSLKEGLTVFRDQEFSADMRSEAVKRIQDVKMLRARQFPEDAGPLAHPIRPESYIEINNFYTATVYEKGAEIIRMLKTLLGWEGFRKGADLYFERHDGQAVTCEDWIRAMEEANGADLSHFRLWYSQSGTPVLMASWTQNPEAGSFEITLSQHTRATPGQTEKRSLQMPVRFGLLNASGQDVLTGQEQDFLILDKASKTFRFENISEAVVPSINRGFSVPVKLEAHHSEADLAFLMAYDSDAFNRWEASQSYLTRVLLKLVEQRKSDVTRDDIPADLIEAFRVNMQDRAIDPAFKALLLTLPALSYVADQMIVADYECLSMVRKGVKDCLAGVLETEWQALYRSAALEESFDPASGHQAGSRALRAVALGYLSGLADGRKLAADLYGDAGNMTDRMAALTAVIDEDCPERQQMLDRFEQRFSDNLLVMDKWLALQAMSQHPAVLDQVEELQQHPAFSWTNPNRVRSLIGAFAMNNPRYFHDLSGRGYRILADAVLKLNDINPQVAARILAPLGTWRRVDTERQGLMKQELERILERENLSRDVYEVASKALGRD
ncbi:aminopeptidase N [Kiloniella sp. b19]|uniref:aminopeptidase N n=1 Tax=Kiloniella sp. GXU_MW_B19 TaxID=3141326 RepID=UPI0031D395FF